MTATMVWEQYSEPGPRIQGYALGSVQFLENGNSLICFGARFPPGVPPAHIQELVEKSARAHNIDPLLVQSALDAVRQWRYRPTQLNGEAVEVDTTIDVIFSLNQ